MMTLHPTKDVMKSRYSFVFVVYIRQKPFRHIVSTWRKGFILCLPDSCGCLCDKRFLPMG